MKGQTKLWVTVGIIAVIIIALLAAFSVQKKEEEVIKIGVTLALSGKYAYIGQAELRGIEMAVDEINEGGGINGKRLKLIVEDNKGDATEATKNVNKLINVDNVDIVFSAFTHITMAIKDIIFNNNKFLFYASTVPDIAAENKYAFRDFYDAKAHGRAIADEAYKLGYKKVAFLTEISDQCKEFEDAFQDESSKLGINIISREEYQTSATDLKTNLLKLNLDNADALIACAWRHEHILMKQLKELGLIDVPTLHWIAPYLPVSDTPEMRELYEENGAISSWYGFSETGNKELQQEFIRKYKERYGEYPIPDSAYTYDDIYIIKRAIEGCGGDINNKDCIAEKILETKYDGVGGKIEFDRNGSAIREVTFIKVKDGKWETLTS